MRCGTHTGFNIGRTTARSFYEIEEICFDWCADCAFGERGVYRRLDANSGGGSGGLSGGGGNGDNVANPFIGTWEGSRDSFFYKLVFDATTVSAYYKTSASESWQSEGSSSYTFSGNRATPQGTGGTPHTFTVSGNVLTVSDGRILHKK